MRWSPVLSRAKSIALRAEEPSRVWERRVCLTPAHVGQLVSEGIDVLVQPSSRRCFKDEEYKAVNASLTSDIRPADIILGVKEPSITELAKYARPNQKWISFWHCHKGQDYNRPLLKQMLATGADYIDWELLTESKGQRTTAFGYLAGYAGLCEGLSQLGVKALHVGIATPLLHLPRPYSHQTVSDLNQSLRQLGERFNKHGTGNGLGPVVVAVVGRGRVAQGAIDALNQIRVKWVEPHQLQSFVKSASKLDHHTLYAVQLTLKDYMKHTDGRPFNRDEFRQFPASFHSVFANEFAPYLTMLLNGAFWDSTNPRIMSDSEYTHLKQRLDSEGLSHKRFLQVADVSADWGGGLQFVKRPSTISDPAFFINQHGEEDASSATKNSTSIMSIEILPSELPEDASAHFSNSSLDYLRTLCQVDDGQSAAFKERSVSLDNAHLITAGQLTMPHAWLKDTVATSSASATRNRKVVLFGSGLVASPAVDELLSRSDYELTIITNDLNQGQALSRGRAQVQHVDLDDQATLDGLLKAHDCAISLLPAKLHPTIAESCIRAGTHLVTASYESPAMSELRQKAQDAGVIIMNELGLDPGLDILSAMQLLDEARQAQRDITAFVSICGGLPAPECSGVPFGYKFSWSPRGVLSASCNSAHYLVNGKEKSIPGDKLLSRKMSSVPTLPGFDLEMLANRDSLPYIEHYGMERLTLKTMFRGTLRYKGFSQLLEAFQALGLTSTAPFTSPPQSWTEVLQGSMVLAPQMMSQALLESADEVNHTLHWLGLIPDSASVAAPFPNIPLSTPMDYLEVLLAHKLAYQDGERDLVLLQNEVTSIGQNGTPRTDVASLVSYGQAMPQGPSAMARTVGLPVALGTSLIVDGLFNEPGVHTPTSRKMWHPMLQLLDARDIRMKRRTLSRATDYNWLDV